MAVATAKTPANGQPDRKHNIDAMRQDYYARIAKHGMTPLWTVMSSLIPDEPVTRCAPAVWHFGDVKSLVMESAGLISAEEAKRRVLILENPALPGEARVTNTLFAGIQMIMPGEIAPAHRHASSAIRFVLDGQGAYTAVEGEKAFMSPGDFLITANWAPHDHGNTSDKPMLWLDVLDVPAVNFFETSFAEDFDTPTQTTTRHDGNSLSFYASGVLPDGTTAMNRTPVINYTYARTRPIVERRMQAGDIDKTPRRARALRQSDQWRAGAADDGRLSCDAAEGFSRRALSLDRRHRFRLRGGRGHHHRRRQSARMGTKRRLRGAVVEALLPLRVETIGAVLDLRPSGAGSARPLARGEVKKPSSLPGLTRAMQRSRTSSPRIGKDPRGQARGPRFQSGSDLLLDRLQHERLQVGVAHHAIVPGRVEAVDLSRVIEIDGDDAALYRTVGIGPFVAAALIAADDVNELGAFAVRHGRQHARQVFADRELAEDDGAAMRGRA